MSEVVINVRGIPAAKGSPHARVHNGHVVMHEGKKTKSWERLVRESIALEIFDGSLPSVPLFVDKPLRVSIVFRLTRPGGHWGTGKRAGSLKPNAAVMPHKKPDIDKLARATLDPLIGSIFDDDSRIVELATVKTYASPGDEGARVVIREWNSSSDLGA